MLIALVFWVVNVVPLFFTFPSYICRVLFFSLPSHYANRQGSIFVQTRFFECHHPVVPDRRIISGSRSTRLHGMRLSVYSHVRSHNSLSLPFKCGGVIIKNSVISPSHLLFTCIIGLMNIPTATSIKKLNNNNLLHRAGNSKTGGVNYILILGCPFLHTYERVITPGIALYPLHNNTMLRGLDSINHSTSLTNKFRH